MKYMLTFVTTRLEATKMVMVAKLARLTQKRAPPLAVLAPGGKSGNFWTHLRMYINFNTD
jgi:hypothetical protein